MAAQDYIGKGNVEKILAAAKTELAPGVHGGFVANSNEIAEAQTVRQRLDIHRPDGLSPNN